jgi:signal peptidase I
MKNNQSKFIAIIRVVFLPLFLIYDVLKSDRTNNKKVFLLLLTIVVFGITYSQTFQQIVKNSQHILFELGVLDNPVEFPTRGPSMLPTFETEDTVTLSNPKKFGLVRGDIVTFTNDETEGRSYLKRIVGLSGESVAIKDGYVWINEQPLSEPYVYKSRPTFGNTYLNECQAHTIPENHFAVMGDNRGASWDSRAIGFVKKDDISGVLKTGVEPSFIDLSSAKGFQKIAIDTSDLIKTINATRLEKKGNPLISNDEVMNAAQERSNAIVNNFEAYKTGNSSVEQTLEDNTYRFNLIHEYVTYGNLTSEEIVQQILDIPSEESLFLSNKFTEIGVGVSERNEGTCTHQIVTVVLSWPSYPTYNSETVNEWKEESNILTENLRNYQSWVGFNEVDQVKLKELISITAQMSVISSTTYQKMSSREWLSSADYANIKNYNSLMARHNQLNDELFVQDSVRGISTRIPDTNW